MTSDDSLTPTCSSKKIRALISCFKEYQAKQQKLLEEIEKEANSLIKSNEKLKATANENAGLVTQTQKRCREYKQENEALKQQLSLIKSARQHEMPSPESDHGGSKPGGREDLSSDEQPDKLERKGSKLSTNKSKKKVRYQELPAEEKKSPVLLSSLPGKDGRENRDPEKQPHISVEEGKLLSSKTQAVKGQASIKKHQDLQSDHGINGVLVPETIPLDVDSDGDYYVVEEEEVSFVEDVSNGMGRTDRGSGMVRETVKQSRQRKSNDQYVVVPETVPVDLLPHSPPEDTLQEDLMMGDARDKRKFPDHFIPLEQSTPMLPTPFSDSSRRKTLTSIESASPVCLDGKRRQSGRIPPTESQLSVDFSTTQMSPTFNGSRSTPNKQESGVQSSTARHQSVSHTGKACTSHETSSDNVPSSPQSVSSRKKISNSAWDTPKDANQARTSHAVTPGYDESGQSEASFLILQSHPSSRGPSQVRPSGEPSKEGTVLSEGQRNSLAGSDGEQRKKRRLSDGQVDETPSKKTRTRKQEDVSFDAKQRDENELSRDRRQKVCHTRTENSEETLRRQSSVAADIQRTEYKDHADKETESTSSSDQPSKKHSTSLKQTRLSKDSFKGMISKEGQRHRDFNGGVRVYADSQDDPYVQKAIQESMKVQERPNQDERTCDGEFKMPRLPKTRDCDQKLKGSSSSGATGRKSHLRDDDAPGPLEGDEEIYVLEEIDNLANNIDGDLNGSIDPAVRFSFIGDEEDENYDGVQNLGLNNGRGVQHGSIDARNSEGRNRSGLHPDSKPINTPHASRTRYEILEEDGVENKRRLLVEDSLDDMFADDDEDDDEDDDGDGPSDEEGYRHDQGIEITEGYGRREDIRSEASLQGRTKCGDDSLPDSGLERRVGETDEMHSSFVRDFDCPPQKDDIPAYKFKEVVRKKDERQKLKGYDCKGCAGYYGGLGLNTEEIAERTKKCSRHRGHYSPPNTPEHYWSIDFPDTQECEKRGYVNVAQEDDMPKRKRKMRYKANFGKSKAAAVEEDS